MKKITKNHMVFFIVYLWFPAYLPQLPYLDQTPSAER
jgi:hypothetical protein